MIFNDDSLQEEKTFLVNEKFDLKSELRKHDLLKAKDLISNQPQERIFNFGYLQKLSPIIQKYLYDNFPDRELIETAFDSEHELTTLNQYRLQKKIIDFAHKLVDKEKKLKPVDRIFSNVFTAYNNACHQLGFFDGTEFFMK